MNIVKNIDQFNDDFVFFCEPIKNNIIDNSSFIRIIYSSSIVSLNGIYIKVKIYHNSTDKYYNKYKCFFDIHKHKDIINKLKNIEETIIQKYFLNCNKKPQYKIYDQLLQGHIKVFTNIDNVSSTNNDKISDTFLLKIAGIWETDNEYGLTYKFICV
jgi:flagellar biosynthesis regulator FlbT